MIRYISQFNSFTCGPIAVVNAFKWLGFQFNGKKTLAEVIKVCGTDKSGTKCTGIDNGIKYLNKKFKVENTPFFFDPCIKLQNAIDYLNDGWAILLLATYPIDGPIDTHSFLMTFYNESFKQFGSVNGPCENKLVSYKEMKEVVEFDAKIPSAGWVIRRLQEMLPQPAYEDHALTNALMWLGKKPEKNIENMSIEDGVSHIIEKKLLPKSVFTKQNNVQMDHVDLFMSFGYSLVIGDHFLAWRSDIGDLFEVVHKGHRYCKREDVVNIVKDYKKGFFVDHRGVIC